MLGIEGEEILFFSLLKRLAATIGTVGSLVALVWSLKPEGVAISWWQSLLIALAGVLLIVQICVDVVEVRRGSPIRLRDDKHIRDYMYEWINNGGRVAIFSRDMSWANDSELLALLRHKAERDELSLYLPQKTELAEQLATLGAHLYTYPGLAYVARTRFTIIHEGRSDAEVAIGRRVDGAHQIEEFAVGSSPVFAMAEDLVEFVRHLNAIGGI